MLIIRKKNFESQKCYCCLGEKANASDLDSSVAYNLYHKTPDKTRHIPVQVIIPRCKCCEENMDPIMSISTKFTGIIVIGILFVLICHTPAHLGFMEILMFLVLSLLCGVFVWIWMTIIIGISFNIVYKQNEKGYEIVKVLLKKYGWQTTAPKMGDKDVAFTDRKLKKMCEDLAMKHNCESLIAEDDEDDE